MPLDQMSRLYYPNKIARIYMQAMASVMGQNGLNAALNLAGLERFIDRYPENTLKKGFDFAEFAALDAALEVLYGPRGGRSLALRAGRACFSQGLRHFGAMAGVRDSAFRVLPLPVRVQMGLHALATIFTRFSDQRSDVAEDQDHFHYVIRDTCPVCYRRQAEGPICHAIIGVLQEGLRWVSGGYEFGVYESQCIANGDSHCVFVIHKNPLGQVPGASAPVYG